jgi:hypothetical protein
VLVKTYKNKELMKLHSLQRSCLLIPSIGKKKKDTRIKVISIDPGARTFETGFNLDGKFIEYEKDEINELFTLGKRISTLQSKIDKHYKASYVFKKERIQYKNRRTQWKRDMAMILNRMNDLKRDIHWKLAREIVPQ